MAAPGSSRSNKTPIKTGRLATSGGLNTPRIVPTPALGRSSSQSQGQSGSSIVSPRRGTASSLADKRRRFLALARSRQKTDNLPSPRPSPLLKFRGTRPSPTKDDDSDEDQEMAETIEVTPSKVKRVQDYTTFFASPGSSNSSSSSRDRSRIVTRKPNRRPGSGQSSNDGGKSRLQTYRRPGLKGRPPLSDNKDADQERSSSAIVSGTESNDHSTKVVPEPTSAAAIAEYLHETREYAAALDSNTVNSLFLSTSVSDGPLGLESSQVVESVLEDDGDVSLSSSGAEPTAPLPDDSQTSSEDDDPKLTVPLQLSIVTSTYSLTETRLRTSLLPVYDGTSTTYYTLTHSFLVTKSVTTFQTVPPEEFMPYLIPGDEDERASPPTADDALNDVLDDLDPDRIQLRRKSDQEADDSKGEETSSTKELLKAGSDQVTASLDEEGKKVDGNVPPNPAYAMGNPLLGNLPLLNLLGPAAALGLNPYFPYGIGLPQVVTTSRPVFSTNVIFTSKLLPIIDGLTTSYHTVNEAASTITHTAFETYTTQVAMQNPLGLGANNLGRPNIPPGVPGQPMSTVTSPHTYVTTETQTATQVFKLMYDGYKTSFRTVSSTNVVTRTVTTYTTTTVPMYTQMLPYFG